MITSITMIEEVIKNSGLTEVEAKVYLALLELGPATVSEVTKKASITRTLGYSILERLGWLGLVDTVSSKNKKIIYSAKHPRYLVQYLKNKQNSWRRKTEEMENRLPDLVSIYKTAGKPGIRYQEGDEGIKNIYDETLEAKDKILSILDIEGWIAPEFKNWMRDYNRKRCEKKIYEDVLILDTPEARDWMKNYLWDKKYTKHKWIKPEELPEIANFGGEINIYDNKVVMALLKKPERLAVIIESTPLSNILKALFRLAWNKS